jgi:hypothetical protein
MEILFPSLILMRHGCKMPLPQEAQPEKSRNVPSPKLCINGL